MIRMSPVRSGSTKALFIEASEEKINLHMSLSIGVKLAPVRPMQAVYVINSQICLYTRVCACVRQEKGTVKATKTSNRR